MNNDDEYFEEMCWICGQVKLVHDDERTNLGNPGFICKECEDERNDYEKFMKDVFGDENE